jgi:hypothetical protein
MSSRDLLHSKKAILRAWHSCGTSLSLRHCSGVFFLSVQQSVRRRQRLRSTRRPEQGRTGPESEEESVEDEGEDEDTCSDITSGRRRTWHEKGEMHFFQLFSPKWRERNCCRFTTEDAVFGIAKY